MNAQAIKVTVDEEGYLLDPSDWSEEVAEGFADQAGLALNDEHWNVVRFMRDYFDEHRIAPDARHTINYMATDMGLGTKARNHLFELFPYGYMQQACKIAGMRRPRAWSTG
jgi:tRNA 2-thiouridine synthesizing protein E